MVAHSRAGEPRSLAGLAYYAYGKPKARISSGESRPVYDQASRLTSSRRASDNTSNVPAAPICIRR
jgi:hypothetical protein